MDTQTSAEFLALRAHRPSEQRPPPRPAAPPPGTGTCPATTVTSRRDDGDNVSEGLEIVVKRRDFVAMLCRGRSQIAVAKIHIGFAGAMQRVKHAPAVFYLNGVGMEQGDQLGGRLGASMLIHPRQNIKDLGHRHGRDQQVDPARFCCREKFRRRRRLAPIIVTEKAEHDIRVEVVTRNHRRPLFSPCAAQAERPLAFSSGSRGWGLCADPKRDRRSGTGRTCAPPSGRSSQITSVDFQRDRNLAGIVV